MADNFSSGTPQDEPIAHINLGDNLITVLGTAHVSQASADKVRDLIATDEYDAVAVELCPSRFNAIINPDTLSKMNLFEVIRKGKAPMVVASLALGAFQQRMAEHVGVEPGAEMRMAVSLAQEAKLPVLLIDREIGTTLKRVYRNVPWWRRMSLFSGLIVSLFTREKVSEEEIERLKEGDMLESTFAQFAEDAQEIYLPLVDERDRYMTARLLEEIYTSDHKKILAIVGAGHLKGIRNYIEIQPTPENEEVKEQISRLDEIPKPSIWPKLIPWLIVALILVGFVYGFSKNSELGYQLVSYWIFINGGLAAFGALIAAAHPLTIVVAFIAAPFTSLNPMIGAGMVTAAAEAAIRKPKVEDFSTLRTDTTQLSGWWKNRVTRTLLVFTFSTIGSALGTYIAGFKIFESVT
ncbi:MAG: TraB/GumN family protein [Gammaproteobacteria bacterium]